MSSSSQQDTSSQQDSSSSEGAPPKAVLAGAWLWVSVPFAYGVVELVQKLQKLFS